MITLRAPAMIVLQVLAIMLHVPAITSRVPASR
jgi:hypothetical protein